jgi:hypothetical protein
MMEASRALQRIKLVHTIAWTLFASAILAIPLMVRIGAFEWALALSALVLVEVSVLLANGMRCPLTAVAARYTNDRSDNFDIYLPVWLARHNKLIFGSIFFFGEAFLAVRWFTA